MDEQDQEQALKDATNLAVSFEGFREAPYEDSVGVWTIGYGSTFDLLGNRVGPHTPAITEYQARLLVANEMHNAAASVAHYCGRLLNTNQSAALYDFVFNLGADALAKSTLLKDIKSGDFKAAAAEFAKWDHAGGKELAGLFRRRAAESRLFVTPPERINSV